MATRREFLALCATGISASLAGCSREETGALSMTQVESDEALGQQLTYQVDPDSAPSQDWILREAIESGSTTVPGDLDPGAYRRDEDGNDGVFDDDETAVADRPPWTPRRPIVHQGRVYEITWSPVDEETRTIYEVRATPAGEGAVEPEIEFSELPALDREKLNHLPPRVAASEEFSVANRYTHGTADLDSAFVPDQEYEVIDVRGEPVAIETRSTTATVTTYRYEAETLADSLADYGAEARDSHEFVLDSLDEDERTAVEEAIEGTYVASDDDEAFEGIVDRFSREQPVIDRDGPGGKWLVEYEGTSYLAELEVYGALGGS